MNIRTSGQSVSVNCSPISIHSKAESRFTSVFKDQIELFEWSPEALRRFNCSVLVLCMFDILRDGVDPQASENLGVPLRSVANGGTFQGGYSSKARARDKRAVEHC